MLRNPVLRSRNLVAQDTTRDLFATRLARRAGLAEPDLAATVQASAALGAIGAAMMAWADGDEAGPRRAHRRRLRGLGGRRVTVA